MPRSLLWPLAVAVALTACQPAPVVGAFCMVPSDCRLPLACRFDRCRTPCTLDGECPAGATCLFARGEGFCGVSQDRPCAMERGCPDGLACVDDTCLARCGDASDCPADGVCAFIPGSTISRVCFRAGEVPDGGSPDAAAP